MVAAASFRPNFQKFKFLTAVRLKAPICVILSNFIKIGQSVAEIAYAKFSSFGDNGRPPS